MPRKYRDAMQARRRSRQLTEGRAHTRRERGQTECPKTLGNQGGGTCRSAPEPEDRVAANSPVV